MELKEVIFILNDTSKPIMKQSLDAILAFSLAKEKSIQSKLYYLQKAHKRLKAFQNKHKGSNIGQKSCAGH